MFILNVQKYLIAKSTMSENMMEASCALLRRYGSVFDIGPPFTSSEFIHFLRMNGIKQIQSAPYYPSSNGQAERFQTLKRSLKASESDGRSLSHRFTVFLIIYPTTPHATTNCSPGEFF